MTATPMRPEPRLQHETRCLVRADGVSTEHRTLLGAMKAARALVEAGHRGVAVVDRRAAIAWRADRLGLTPMLDLDRECMFAAQQSAVSDSGGRDLVPGTIPGPAPGTYCCPSSSVFGCRAESK